MSTTIQQYDDRAADAALVRDVERLVTDARHVRAATILLSGAPDEAEQRYADEVAATLSILEFDLRTARAALDARRADSTEDLHHALSEVEDAARSWLDDLGLQARLARMEARDRTDGIARRLERARAEAKRAVIRVSDAVESDLDEMRRVTVHEIGEVRAALRDATMAIRSADD
jgi:hypothetical protein